MQRATRTFSVVLMALALVGIGVSVELYSLHLQLSADPSFGTFCNVNEVFSCGVVLTSRYASLLGVPVAVWAGSYYVLLAGLGYLVWRGAAAGASAAAARTARRAATWAFAQACFGVVVSGYFAVLAFGVVGAVCLMCGALYLVAAAVWLTAWRLRRTTVVESRGRTASGPADRWATIAAFGLTLAVLAGAGWEAFGPSPYGLTADQIAKKRPDFYRWYLAQPVVSLPVDGGRELGPATAPVTITSYSDFECAHCAALARSLHEVLPRYSGQVRVVFHNYPLDRACNPSVTVNMHTRACRAAVAADCAGQQGRFWPYHDLLFENQQHLGDSDLIAYAERVGVDRAQFESCLAGSAARERVDQDVRSGAALGVESTPTVFINGRRIKGALDAELMGYALAMARSGAAHP